MKVYGRTTKKKPENRIKRGGGEISETLSAKLV